MNADEVFALGLDRESNDANVVGAGTMKIEISPVRNRIVSFCMSFLLMAPGFYVGILGLTDMAPSSPRGFSALAELMGFGFCTWAIFSSIRAQSERFLNDVLAQTGSLIATFVLAYGFYLLMTVIGLEASSEHKEALIRPLQPLGLIGLFLLISQVVRGSLRYRFRRPRAEQ